MGADWRTLTYKQYQVLLAGWNRLHDQDKDEPRELSPERADRLRRLMNAHTVH